MKTFSMKPGDERSRYVSCPLCGSNLFKPMWNGSGPFVKCRECDLVYQNPQPVFDDLAARYDEAYYEYEIENEKQFFSLMRLGLRDIAFYEIEKNISGEKHFVDVGCATGMLLEDMKKRGWHEFGVEICKPAVEWGRKNRAVSIHCGPLESADIEIASVDVLHCSHLIEHLVDPIAFVKRVNLLLKPGGYFIVTTPNIEGLQARIFGYQWRSAIDDHMVLFGKQTLKSMLKAGGFSLHKTKTWGGLASGAGFSFLKKPLDRMAKVFGFGDVMIMLATKK